MSRATWLGHGLSTILLGSLAGCALRSPSFSDHAATAQSRTVAVAIQQGLTIRWVKHPADVTRLFVEVEGLKPEAQQALSGAAFDQSQWPRIFSVYVDQPGQAAANEVPAIQGRYEILGDRIRFEPQYPVQLGMSYRVEVRTGMILAQPSSNSPPVVARFKLAAPVRTPKTVVRHVYPSAKKLPENLLKFYLHFSGPMSRGEIYQYIHLVDPSGHLVDLPFLEIDEELWNPELTRLTLFIDPGRIKRGVQPLEEIGPAVEAGKRYTLVIDSKWQDGDGVPLKTSYRKTFEVVAPDRDPPDATAWAIHSPKANTRAPLVVRFSEPLDDALAQRLIWVIDADQRKLAGHITLSNEEQQWNFTPDTNWRSGRYQIVADTLLEDLAGNSLGKPFEVDVFERVEDKSSKKTVALPFEVSNSGSP